jgi:hypothetical protein
MKTTINLNGFMNSALIMMNQKNAPSHPPKRATITCISFGCPSASPANINSGSPTANISLIDGANIGIYHQRLPI